MTSSSSLYGSTPQTGVVSSSNFTTLYSGGGGPAPTGNFVVPGTLTVNGCAILTNCSSFSLLPTTAQTILFGGEATLMSIGSGTGTTTINNQLATANYTFPVADGVAGQVLVTDGAGTVSFAPASTVGKTYSIDASATTGGANFNLVSSDPTTDTIKFANGTNMSVVRTDANTITFSATDTNTTYTQDASATTGGANLNLVGSDSSVDPVKFAEGSNITITATDANTITISATNDGNTTYTQDISATTGGANLNLVGSDATIDTVKFASGTGVTVTATDANTATISIGQSVATTADVTFSQVTIDTLATYNTQTTTTTSLTPTSISSTTRLSQKAIIKAVNNVTGEIHILEALAFYKGTTAYLTTYAEMYTSVALATFTADVSGGAIRILATPTSTNSTTFNVCRVSLT